MTETSTAPAVTGFYHFSPTVSDVEASALNGMSGSFRMNRVPVTFPHYGAEESGYAVLLIDPRSGIAIGLHYHQANPGQLFHESRTGLDHISLGVADRAARRMGKLARRTRHRALRRDRHRQADALLRGRLRDPDNIQLELFHMPS